MFTIVSLLGRPSQTRACSCVARHTLAALQVRRLRRALPQDGIARELKLVVDIDFMIAKFRPFEHRREPALATEITLLHVPIWVADAGR